jgi:hypothetical protein
MKRLAFPLVLAAILVAGIAFSSASNAARRGISEEDLLRTGHTIDPSCGAATTGAVKSDGEPVQIAAAPIKCAQSSDGNCINEGAVCGRPEKKGGGGLCTTVINKHKRPTCACVTLK